LLCAAKPALWNLLEEFSTELCGNVPMQLMPAIPMRDPACRIDAASGTESIPWRSGLILHAHGIEAVEHSNGTPQSCMEEFCSNTTSLEGPVAASAGANGATDSNVTWRACLLVLCSRFGQAVGLGRSIRIPWKNRMQVSFISKDTFQCARDRCGSLPMELQMERCLQTGCK